MSTDGDPPKQSPTVEPAKASNKEMPGTDLAKETAILGIEKLRLEIRDLRLSSNRSNIALAQAISTGVLTIVVAVGGWFIQSKLNTDDSFDRSVQEAVGTSAPERAGGAVGLSAFMSDPLKSRIALKIMIARLSKEDDPIALGILSNEIAESGPDAAADVANANRTAASAFASSLGRYVGLMIHDRIVASGQMKRFKTYSKSLQNIILDSSAPGDSNERALQEVFRDEDESAAERVQETSIPLNTTNLTITPPQFLIEQSLRHQYRIAMTAAADLEDNQRRKDDIRSALQEVDESARGLAATSDTLTQILGRWQTDVSQRVSLHNIVLLNARLDEKDLSGADLRNSYISGTGLKLRCNFCDLRGAILSQCYLTGATLEYTALAETSLRNLSDSPAGTSDEMPDLTAADWWNARFPENVEREAWAVKYSRESQHSHESTSDAVIAAYLSNHRQSTLKGDFDPEPYIEGNHDATPSQVAKM